MHIIAFSRFTLSININENSLPEAYHTQYKGAKADITQKSNVTEFPLWSFQKGVVG